MKNNITKALFAIAGLLSFSSCETNVITPDPTTTTMPTTTTETTTETTRVVPRSSSTTETTIMR